MFAEILFTDTLVYAIAHWSGPSRTYVDFSQDQRGRLVYVRTAVAVTCIRIKSQARIFLLVDLQDFFFRFRVEGDKKK